MLRLEPEFIEPISERICNFITDWIIDVIWNNPHKNPNEAIHDFIKNYYEKRKNITHRFSGSLIYLDIIDHIKSTINANSVEFQKVTDYAMEKIIACGIDFVIDEVYDTFKYPNINEKDHIKYAYSREMKCLLRIKADTTKMLTIENALKTNFSADWRLFKRVWENFKKDKIPIEEFLLISFMCFEKQRFIDTLRKTQPILKCLGLTLNEYKKQQIKLKEMEKKWDTQNLDIDFNIETCRVLAPSDDTYLYKLGALYLNKGDMVNNRDYYQKAIECFNKIIVPNQMNMYLRNAYWGLAEAYERMEDLDKSKECRNISKQYDKKVEIMGDKSISS